MFRVHGGKSDAMVSAELQVVNGKPSFNVLTIDILSPDGSHTQADGGRQVLAGDDNISIYQGKTTLR